MLASYAFVGVFFLAALSFPVVPLILAFFLRPRRPAPLKQSTYECGLEAIGDIRVQFKVQYYLYALAFVIFDIEVVFLYPIGVILKDADSLFVLGELVVFVVLLLIAFVYVWRKGALDWR